MDALTCEIRENGGDGVLSVTVRFQRFDGERVQYGYSLSYAGETVAEGNDLRSGCGEDVNHPKMMGALLSFLGAAGESYRYNGNRMGDDETSLFPERACEVAYSMADEIAMAQLELEGEDA